MFYTLNEQMYTFAFGAKYDIVEKLHVDERESPVVRKSRPATTDKRGKPLKFIFRQPLRARFKTGI